MNCLICLCVLVCVRLQWLQHCSIFTSFCEDFWLPTFWLLAHVSLDILGLLLWVSLGGMRQAAQDKQALHLLRRAALCPFSMLVYLKKEKKKLGMCKRMKFSDLEAEIKERCLYSEGETINTIPENTLLLLHFCPNESSFAVITWQLWWLINNNPKKYTVSQYLQWLRIMLTEEKCLKPSCFDMQPCPDRSHCLISDATELNYQKFRKAARFTGNYTGNTPHKALALATRAKIFQHLLLFRSAEAAQMLTQLHLLFWEVTSVF